MELELEKSMRIISDLVSYCGCEGATEVSMHLKRIDDHSTSMSVSAPVRDLHPDKLDIIRQTLSAPRQHEIEQDFWELSGETEFGAELSLVAAMIDDASVEYANGQLHIYARRDD